MPNGPAAVKKNTNTASPATPTERPAGAVASATDRDGCECPSRELGSKPPFAPTGMVSGSWPLVALVAKWTLGPRPPPLLPLRFMAGGGADDRRWTMAPWPQARAALHVSCRVPGAQSTHPFRAAVHTSLVITRLHRMCLFRRRTHAQGHQRLLLSRATEQQLPILGWPVAYVACAGAKAHCAVVSCRVPRSCTRAPAPEWRAVAGSRCTGPPAALPDSGGSASTQRSMQRVADRRSSRAREAMR